MWTLSFPSSSSQEENTPADREMILKRKSDFFIFFNVCSDPIHDSLSLIFKSVDHLCLIKHLNNSNVSRHFRIKICLKSRSLSLIVKPISTTLSIKLTKIEFLQRYKNIICRVGIVWKIIYWLVMLIFTYFTKLIFAKKCRLSIYFC